MKSQEQQIIAVRFAGCHINAGTHVQTHINLPSHVDSMRISNGTITVDGELDKGAMLTVMLPLVEGNTEYVAKFTAIHPHAMRHTCGPSNP